jgi:hypothetical protein
MEIIHNAILPNILGRGRPKGSGKNLRMLNAMHPGDAVENIPKERIHSIRASAGNVKMKVICRKLENGNYMIMRPLA